MVDGYLKDFLSFGEKIIHFFFLFEVILQIFVGDAIYLSQFMQLNLDHSCPLHLADIVLQINIFWRMTFLGIGQIAMFGQWICSQFGHSARLLFFFIPSALPIPAIIIQIQAQKIANGGRFKPNLICLLYFLIIDSTVSSISGSESIQPFPTLLLLLHSGLLQSFLFELLQKIKPLVGGKGEVLFIFVPSLIFMKICILHFCVLVHQSKMQVNNIDEVKGQCK